MHVASRSNGVPATAPEQASADGVWIDVCALDDIVPQTGVCALLGRKQVAIFRVAPSGALGAGETSALGAGELCSPEPVAGGFGNPPRVPGTTDDLYALSNFDPFSKAFVLSRGIVGDKGGVPKVASPVFKQSFDLRTGQCLDDPTVSVKRYPVRLRGNRVEVFFDPQEEKSRVS
jgi:nitrite reductase (NADH) small subunit